MNPSPLFQVALPIPADRLFTYEVPEKLRADAMIGKRVSVPVGRRSEVGYLIGPTSSRPEGPIKAIEKVIDREPLFGEEEFDLYSRAAAYYRFPLGEALKAVLPKARRIPSSVDSVSDAVVPSHRFALTSEQREILKELESSLSKRGFSPFLLRGVTGSGKTEIYLQATQRVVEQGRSVLVLVPEIALTPQLIERFRSRFGPSVFAYHSAMTAGERLRIWTFASRGEAPIVLGTRSAVFVPLKDLGLIIVDEEHDSSYKQQEGFRYNGRDLAIWRAKLSSATLLLGSATPSVESTYRAQRGPWRLLELSKRVGDKPMGAVSLVDLRDEKVRGPFFPPLSEPLAEAICEAISQKQQAILFLNRRGFAPALFCADCGHVSACPACSVHLTYHRRENLLKCHHCGSQIGVPLRCHSCAGTTLKPVGQGTERVEEMLQRLAPKARIARMDRDTIVSRRTHAEILHRFAHGDADILLGTQMVTKGFDFPRVTLVGVLDADQSLHFPDFRAAERTFQLLTQVAGRSGRGEASGRVLIQTYSPRHYAISAASGQDYALFYEQELRIRREVGYPPWGRLVALRLSGTKEQKVANSAKECAARLKEWISSEKITKDVELLGPAPPLVSRVAGRFRYQIVLKAAQRRALDRLLDRLSRCLERRPRQWNGCRLDIDVDPQSLA